VLEPTYEVNSSSFLIGMPDEKCDERIMAAVVVTPGTSLYAAAI